MIPSLQTFTGSLLQDEKTLVASYDLESLPFELKRSLHLQALRQPGIYNYALRPFSLDFRQIQRLCIINGMGVTLGDSLIGISALHAIKTINPNIHLTVLRPHTCPAWVEEIYQLAGNVIDELHFMPQELASLEGYDALIDAGNQLFRADFATQEMHDFFLRHLGIAPETVPEEIKANRWLRDGMPEQTSPLQGRYVLFNHRASTRLRNIPDAVLVDFIEYISRQHGLPVAGFGKIEHPQYIDLSARSKTTADFIAIIRHASKLYTCDSSALHIAAAFDVPTTGYFNAIKPALRASYYPLCESVDMGTERSAPLHQSEDSELLKAIEDNYRRYLAAV
ncbi:glycosyltransferase family 9 protein [Enterobacter sp. Cy-643]|uniref:glycosyltransferase family 9 protein n=1 Tax=Enterobacter sp. Cy-643 TaxID=2608346 RepID=UPI0014209523|nr:glycosyltransferase family 9 protein [Enterobacter sp. Cy-643]NIF31816.1 glycosyltransferase family 9 protein [Enterobacter sp. Cy-643]